MYMAVWNYQCCVPHSPMFVKGPVKCGVRFTWPWENNVSFHLKQAFLNRFGEANYVLSNWQNQPSKKCMVFSNPECMTLPANILNVIMWVRSWSISLKIGTCGYSSLSLLMYQNLKLKLSSAGCPSWEAQGFIFSDTQLFVAASANAGGFVDVAPIRKWSHLSIRLDLPLCWSLHGCRARVACACTGLAGCCLLGLGIGMKLVCVCVWKGFPRCCWCLGQTRCKPQSFSSLPLARCSRTAEELAPSGSAPGFSSQGACWAVGWFCVSRVPAFFR